MREEDNLINLTHSLNKLSGIWSSHDVNSSHSSLDNEMDDKISRIGVCKSLVGQSVEEAEDESLSSLKLLYLIPEEMA